MEVWEDYRQSATDQRKLVEAEITSLDGRLEEINTELGEEAARKARLKELRGELERLSTSRLAQEAVLEQARRSAAQIEEQRKLVLALEKQLENVDRQVAEDQARLTARQQEQAQFRETLTQAGEIEAAYQAWQQARHDVEYWDEIAVRFRDGEKRRQAPLDEINAATPAWNKSARDCWTRKPLSTLSCSKQPPSSSELEASQAAVTLALEESATERLEIRARDKAT